MIEFTLKGWHGLAPGAAQSGSTIRQHNPEGPSAGLVRREIAAMRAFATLLFVSIDGLHASNYGHMLGPGAGGARVGRPAPAPVGRGAVARRRTI
jgi:hypothetical protein